MGYDIFCNLCDKVSIHRTHMLCNAVVDFMAEFTGVGLEMFMVNPLGTQVVILVL